MISVTAVLAVIVAVMNITNYITPYGSMLVGVDASRIDVVENNENIQVDIAYTLDVNYEHLANCEIRMDISAKNAFSLDKMMQ